MKTLKDKTDTKKRFLKVYKSPEAGANISTVCSAVGISRDTFYRWSNEDKKFADAMEDLKMEKCDEMEQALYQRGYEKDTTALIFWLKNNHPKYKQNAKDQAEASKQPLTVNIHPEWIKQYKDGTV